MLDHTLLRLLTIVDTGLDLGFDDRHASNNTLHGHKLIYQVRLETTRCHVIGCKVTFKVHIILLYLGWESHVVRILNGLLLAATLLLVFFEVLHGAI